MYIPIEYITHGAAFAAGVACTLWFFYAQYKKATRGGGEQNSDYNEEPSP